MTTDDAVRALGGAASFDHVAHALPSIRSALPIYRDVLGGELVHVADSPTGFRAVQVAFGGGTKIELIEPVPGSTFLDRFLARNPTGGLHHVTFRVADVAAAAEAAERAGFTVFGLNLERPEWKEAFVHPRVAHGALVQFAEIAPGFPPRMSSTEVEAVLEGSVHSGIGDTI